MAKYIMKVFDKIERLDLDDEVKRELTRVITELIPIRHSQQKTSQYFSDYLCADKRAADVENGIMAYRDLLQGEIALENVSFFRTKLLSVIEKEPSFGYIYSRLAMMENRLFGEAFFNTLIDVDKINYAIEFDDDELSEKLEHVDSVEEQYRMINNILDKSRGSVYKGDLRDAFEAYCIQRINDIKEELISDSYKDKIREKGHQQNVLPEELNTERARKYFAKAIEAGYMECTPTGFKWLFNKQSKASLAYFTEKVFCPNMSDRYPEGKINTLFNVSRIGSARNQVYSACKPQKWRDEIDKLFKD